MHDVIIIGLGGMGSAAALELASRGRKVLGLDRFTPPHNRGSSHGASRIIRQAYHEHPDYVPLVQRSFELWDRLESDSGEEILRLTGGLMIGGPNSSVVQGAISSAIQHSLPHEILSAPELRRRYPAFQPRDEDVAVFESRAGFVRPEAAIRAQLGLAARRGADLHFEEPVTGWTASPGGSVHVTTSKASYQAERLIIAPGAWAPELLADLQIPFDVRRQVMCWFQPAGSGQAFLPDRFPVYIYDVDGSQIFYGFPAIDGAAGGVKAAMHTAGQRCSADTLNRSISDADTSLLRTQLTRFLPDLNGPLVKACTCLYTLTPDEHFVVAPHPLHSQVTVAAGFSGHGFKFVPVIGEIVANLTLSGATDHPIKFLSASRFPRFGATNL